MIIILSIFYYYIKIFLYNKNNLIFHNKLFMIKIIGEVVIGIEIIEGGVIGVAIGIKIIKVGNWFCMPFPITR